MYLFHDTETTGVEATSHIVQMAMMLVDQDRNVVACFKSLIKPAGWVIPPATVEFHGIKTDQCEAFGLGIKSAIGLFNAWAQRAAIYVGHNPDFDIARMKYEAQNCGVALELPPEKYCTMTGATEHCKLPGRTAGKYKWPTLQEAHEILIGKKMEGAHDAFNDVRATARIYFTILDLERKARNERQAQNG